MSVHSPQPEPVYTTAPLHLLCLSKTDRPILCHSHIPTDFVD